MITLKNTLFEGIIFDIDGTLWDSTKACAIAWNDVLNTYGYNHKLTEQDARSLSGIKLEIMFPQFFPFVPKSQYSDILECYKNKEKYFMKILGGTLYPNVIHILKQLSKKTKLYIVSNCIDGYIEIFINFNKLHLIFTDYESAGKTGLEKKENLRLLIERNQIENPLYIGDTISDYEAAISNNIPFIYAAYGFGNVTNAEYKIDNFSDLLILI